VQLLLAGDWDALEAEMRPRWRAQLKLEPCNYCGAPVSRRLEDRTIDHIRPQVHGGNNELENLASACKTCNGEKGSNTLLQFLVLRAMPTAHSSDYYRRVNFRPQFNPLFRAEHQKVLDDACDHGR
jgi:hypothetical protein